MNVERDVDKVMMQLIHENGDKVSISDFYYLLAEIVSKLVDHHVRDDWQHAMDQASKEVRIESLWLNLLL